MAIQSERSSLNLPCGSEVKMTSSQSLYMYFLSQLEEIEGHYCGNRSIVTATAMESYMQTRYHCGKA